MSVSSKSIMCYLPNYHILTFPLVFIIISNFFFLTPMHIYGQDKEIDLALCSNNDLDKAIEKICKDTSITKVNCL